MHKEVILGSMLALGACGAAFAEGNFSYSYAEAGYINSEFGSVDGDGPAVFGSVALTDMLHAFGSYSDQDLDSGVDFQYVRLGAGANFSIASNVDLIGRFSLVETEADVRGISRDDDGYALDFFIRGRAAQKLELTAGFNYQDLDDGGEDTSIAAGARYYLSDKLAGGLDLLENDGDMAYILGVRYDFGR